MRLHTQDIKVKCVEILVLDNFAVYMKHLELVVGVR